MPCTVRGVTDNLNLRDSLATIRTIFVTFVSKIAPSATRILDLVFGSSTATPSDAAYRNVICKGEIDLSFPNSWAECINQTFMACQNGKPVTAPVVRSLIGANQCILNKILTTAPMDAMEAMFCDFVDAAEVYASLMPVGKRLYKLLLGNLCE
ncbi:uncharacterized protein LOC144140012 [Haemaphysalis longicornis]